MSTRRRRLRSCKWLLRPASLPLRWVETFWLIISDSNATGKPDLDSSLVYLVKKSIKKHDFNTCVNHSVNLVQIKCRPDLVYRWHVTRCDPSEPFCTCNHGSFFHLKFLGWYCHFGLFLMSHFEAYRNLNTRLEAGNGLCGADDQCYCYRGYSGNTCLDASYTDYSSCGYRCTFDQGLCEVSVSWI